MVSHTRCLLVHVASNKPSSLLETCGPYVVLSTSGIIVLEMPAQQPLKKSLPRVQKGGSPAKPAAPRDVSARRQTTDWMDTLSRQPANSSDARMGRSTMPAGPAAAIMSTAGGCAADPSAFYLPVRSRGSAKLYSGPSSVLATPPVPASLNR